MSMTTLSKLIQQNVAEAAIVDEFADYAPEQAAADRAAGLEILRDINHAQMIHAQLGSIVNNAEGASADLLITSANNVLCQLGDDCCLELPSMESIEETPEIALEGIKETMGKLGDFIKGAMKKFKDSFKSFGKAFKYTFTAQHKNAEQLLNGLKANGVQIETVKLSPKEATMFQIGGKPVPSIPKAYDKVATESANAYDYKSIRGAVDMLDKMTFDNAFEARKSISAAVELFLKDTGQTEVTDGSITIRTGRDEVIYATAPVLGGYRQFTTIKDVTLEDGKTIIKDYNYQGWRSDKTSKYPDLPKEMPALDAAALESMLNNLKKISTFAPENFESLWDLYIFADNIWDAVGEAVKDTRLSQSAFNDIVNETHSLVMGHLIHAEYYFGHLDTVNEVVANFAKKHIKL